MAPTRARMRPTARAWGRQPGRGPSVAHVCRDAAILAVDEVLLFSKCYLASSERDDAAGGVVGGDADGDSIAGHDFDTKTPHAAAQLGEHLVA